MNLQYNAKIYNLFIHNLQALLHVSANVPHPQGGHNTRKYKHKVKTSLNIYIYIYIYIYKQCMNIKKKQL
jgi:hypothetical protein